MTGRGAPGSEARAGAGNGGKASAASPSDAATPSKSASPPDAARRTARALRRLLGSARVRVDAEGPEGEVAVIRLPPTLLPRVLAGDLGSRVVERARSEGFRYAALDLAVDGEGGGGEGASGAAAPGQDAQPGQDAAPEEDAQPGQDAQPGRNAASEDDAASED